MERVLVAGLNCRPVALSAKKLGFEVHVVDFFGDVDLKRGVDRVYSVKGEYSASKIVDKAVSVAEDVKPDGLFLTSEVGCNPEYVKRLEKYTVFGNNSRQVKSVREWEPFFARLDELGIVHPKTCLVSCERDAEKAYDEIDFPMVVKPTHGSSGAGISLATSIEDIFKGIAEHGEVLAQQYIRGDDLSVSCLATGDTAKAISVNRQFLGRKFLGCSAKFQYCGNMVPYSGKHAAECAEITEQIGAGFGLAGSFGVDFVLAEKPYVIEVNPRFQDTLECVERVCGVNMVELHMKALGGQLPGELSQNGVCAKGILYAKKDLIVDGLLTSVKDCVDVYTPETRVAKGEPVCSAFGSGKTDGEAFVRLENKVKEIKKFLRYV
ncbi:MAG: ATP-grasp domain-containing protein [Candidatus Altiarchaeota archaeon]